MRLISFGRRYMVKFYGNERSRSYYSEWLKENGDRYEVVISCQYPERLEGGGVNIHYGLLPFYRGCNPIYWQMVNGDVVGVTLHWMTGRFDDGDIIDTFIFPHFGMTADEVYDKCERAGLELLKKNIDAISNGVNGEPQNEKQAKYYRKDAVDFEKEKRITGVFFSPDTIRKVFATHFKGKQYPIINIGGRDFELRAVSHSG